MRILLTNNHLVQQGGSETWTLTMATYLARSHEVVVYTEEAGPFARQFSVPVVSDPQGRFDLALANHNSCIRKATQVSRCVIQTCHGIYPELEQPHSGADFHVAVSEEVQEHLRTLGFECVLLRNGIDCTRFAPRGKTRMVHPRVLSMCQTSEGMEAIASACTRAGLEFDYLHLDRMVDNVEDYINAADLVVGLGRSAFEAMACGRSVLVFDKRPYTPHTADGMVTRENVTDLIRCNLSGRAKRIEANPDTLAFMFASYDHQTGAYNRRFALEHLNVDVQARKYLALHEQLSAQSVNEAETS